MSQPPYGGEPIPAGNEPTIGPSSPAPSPYAPPSAGQPSYGSATSDEEAPGQVGGTDAPVHTGGPDSAIYTGSDLPPAAAPAGPARRPLWRTAGLVAAGLAAGAVMVGLLQPSDASPATTTTAAASSRSGTATDPGGTGRAAAPGGALTGRADEEHVVGTLTAVTSTSVTVRSTAGTATYTVDADTDVREDGEQVAVTALSAGEQVLVHVIPGAAGDYAERVLAGTSAAQGRGGPAGPPAGGAPSTTADSRSGAATA